MSRAFFSAQFYSKGRAQVTDNPTELKRRLSNHLDNYIVTYTAEALPLPNDLLQQVRKIKTIQTGEGTFVLYRVRLDPH